jgi:hypothetical protein
MNALMFERIGGRRFEKSGLMRSHIAPKPRLVGGA